jgi:hypothetical protein
LNNNEKNINSNMAELDKIIEEKKASAGILEYIFGTLAVFAAVPFVLAYYICVIIINIIKAAVNKIGDKF